MENTKDMSKGTPWKVMITFAIPIFLSNLFQQLYNSVDSVIVGNFLGTNALAAVSSSGNLIFLLTSFFTGTAMGAGVIIARYFGEKNYENMRKAIHTDIAFGLIASIFLTVAGIFLSPVILKWMRTDAEVLPESISYFRNYFIGVTGVIMYNIFSGILNALGNSRRVLYYLIFSSLLNVCLDLLFIGVFRWGVGAASVATAISQLSSALLCFFFLLRKGTIYRVKIREIRFHREMLLQIIKYGLPSGVQNSVIALANVIVQSNINTFGGEAMAGCGTYAKLEGFAFLPITCFSVALTNFIGQNLGAGEYNRAKTGARFGILCSCIMAEAVGVCMFLFMPFLARLFTEDNVAVSYSVLQARTVCLFYCLLAFSHSIAAICRGAGKAFVPMIVMLLVWCVIRVAYISIAISIDHSIQLLFIAYPLTWCISSIIFLIYYKKSDWVYGFTKERK